MTDNCWRKVFSPDNKCCSAILDLSCSRGKLKSKWSGPFTIKDVKPYGVVELMDPSSDDPKRSLVVNAQRLKLYHGGDIERLTTILNMQDP